MPIKSHNRFVDVLTDPVTGDVVGYSAKGGSILRATCTEAEADFHAGRWELAPDLTTLPQTPEPKPARCR